MNGGRRELARLSLLGLSVGDAYGESCFSRDTTCAIVGGIVVLSAPGGVPEVWARAAEPSSLIPERYPETR